MDELSQAVPVRAMLHVLKRQRHVTDGQIYESIGK